MKGFIEVTELRQNIGTDGWFEDKLSISTNNIIQFKPQGQCCMLVIFYSMETNVSHIICKESYEEIIEKIKNSY